MERKVELLLAAGVVVLLAAGCATAHPTMAPAGIDLRGSWVIDTAASTGPGFRQGRGGETGQPGQGEPGVWGRGGRGGFGRPGGFGGGMRGGRGRRGGGRYDPERMARMRDAMRALMPSANQVDVLEADTLVRLQWGDGRTMDLSTNGKKHEADWGDLKVAMKAKWTDGALELERKAEGVTVVEHWMRNPDTTRMTVDVKVSGPFPRALQFVRVYNLEKNGS
ncbi:MAG: hypothetical protein P8099_09605 [Gemmatimonadota bacterium]